MSPVQVAMAVVTVTLWGINYPLTKWVVPELPPFMFLTLRMLLFAPLLFFVGAPPRGYRARLWLLSMTQYVLPTGAVVYALQQINSGLVGILTQLETPLAALLGVVILKEKMALAQALGLAVAFGGVVLVGHTPDLSAHMMGMAFCLGSALSFATYGIQVRTMRELRPFDIVVWTSLLAVPSNLLVSLGWEHATRETLTQVSSRCYLWVAVMAVTNLVSYCLWNDLLAKNPLHKVVPFAFALPFVAMITGYLLMDEHLSLDGLFGGLIIMMGIIIVERGVRMQTALFRWLGPTKPATQV